MNSNKDRILIDGLSKSYKSIKALDKISFQIPEGSIFALLGPNGSGKSTLIKILARLIRDWEGSILYNGDTIRGNNNYLNSFGFIVSPLPVRVYVGLWAEHDLLRLTIVIRDARHSACRNINRIDLEAIINAVRDKHDEIAIR